jgi:hypothetical protein
MGGIDHFSRREAREVGWDRTQALITTLTKLARVPTETP